ncbi:3-oxoacyl-ACP reductase FabG [Gordonia sp. KTR9]|uniref:3-oxoacyl-ACP reductase FabG n=1 Tax=Gordonia sp. KTR9 TaxID=337191 RepID=UPI00027DDC09|nr:3-oxoacyl-ACP reductase FabG [Gordonia sp. KTR9]AFR48188.1 short-chain dehydorgenase/reductase [Gordonia sp. KTR9]
MSTVTTLLEGRTAVVTGAAQGIGLEIARVLGVHGAKVVLADLRDDAVLEAAAGLRGQGIQSIGVQCDVTDEDEVRNVVDHAVTEFGGLDVWVNNAGITRDASLKKMSLADFRLVTDVHLTGTWLGVRAASARMRENGGGAIVNISSMSGKAGNPGQTNYSAAKAGIVGMTKAAAKELAHHGVRVNAVQPGLIETAMTRAMPAESFAAMEASIPMRRAGQPVDVANVVLFLSSGLAGYMTGAVLEVAGGRLM